MEALGILWPQCPLGTGEDEDECQRLGDQVSLGAQPSDW